MNRRFDLRAIDATPARWLAVAHRRWPCRRSPSNSLLIFTQVKAVKEDKEVIDFLRTCGEENLQFLLHPPRLKKALEVLGRGRLGEIDIEEWRV